MKLSLLLLKLSLSKVNLRFKECGIRNRQQRKYSLLLRLQTPQARKTNFWVNDLSRSHHAIFQRQKKLCEHRVIVSLDSLPQIFTWIYVWNFYLQGKFMAFSLSFFFFFGRLKQAFCPAFQHFLLWPEPQLLNTTLNLALWSWKFRWNYSIIDFKAEACVSLMASLWLVKV